jgi:hypothetical protein
MAKITMSELADIVGGPPDPTAIERRITELIGITGLRHPRSLDSGLSLCEFYCQHPDAARQLLQKAATALRVRPMNRQGAGTYEVTERLSGRSVIVTHCGSMDGDRGAIVSWRCECDETRDRFGSCRHIVAVSNWLDAHG